jgi:Ser/Thr protein kinase RdoA (MazF antagonist)
VGDTVISQNDPEADLANAIAVHFGLGSAAGPMTSVDRGVMGQVWLLRTDSGRWAVKSLFGDAEPESVTVDVRLQKAAMAAGLSLPRPIPGADGQFAATIEDRAWRVYEWHDLGPAPVPPVAPALAESMGAVLARLHRLALPPPGPVFSWFTEPPAAEDWSDLLSRARDAGHGWAPALAKAVPVLLDLGSAVQTGEHPPAILCHCDLNPGNVRGTGDAGLVVFDWEHAGALPPLWELGYVLVQWCFVADGSVDTAAAGAIVAAYRREMSAAVDVDLGIFTAAIGSWLNFTAGTVAHALEDAGPDEQEFLHTNLTRLLDQPLSRDVLDQLLVAVK